MQFQSRRRRRNRCLAVLCTAVVGAIGLPGSALAGGGGSVPGASHSQPGLLASPPHSGHGPEGAESLEATEAPGPRPSQARHLLVGIIVGSREVATIEVEYDGTEFLLPLDDFLSFCECELHEGRQGREILTPIGSVLLGRSDTVEIGDLTYIRERTLTERLVMRVVYDRARFALVIDIPWYGRRTGPGGVGVGVLRPDIRAPSATISSAIVRLRHSRRASGAVSSANTRMFGRVAGGLWRVRYDDDFSTSRSLSEYGWMRRVGQNKLFMVGHQRVGLHPLLSTLEVTGAQAAWTNQPLDLFQTSLQPTELLPRQLRSRTAISGVGVPAGTAVLRVNDQTIAVQTIGLDGLYEFLEVPLAASQTSRIEVLIFDRYNPTTPVDIHDHSRTASEAMLPQGAFVTQGGFGRSGNVAAPGAVDGSVGFFQARYGISRWLTLEGAAQIQAGQQQLAVGTILQPNPWTVASLAAARSNGRNAYQLDASYQHNNWRAQATSRQRQSRFYTVRSPAESEHFVEVSRSSSSHAFEIGLVGRVRSGENELRFLRPAMSWRPSHKFFLRARPDFDGAYRFDASWQPNRGLRLGLSRARNTTRIDVSRTVSRSLRLSAQGAILDQGGSRIAGLAAWFGDGRFAPSISAGPMLTSGRPGAIVQIQAQPFLGMLLAARYETHSVIDRPDAALDHRLTLSLTSNLSFSGGVLPGGLTGASQVLGGIAGRLRVDDDYDVAAEALERLTIRIDGLTSVLTRTGGFFRLSNLPEGVYRVRLDTDRLPIELSARHRSLLVEVLPGAVTRVDFVLDVAFGIAGRVRINGQATTDALVELVGNDGVVVATARSDRFGLYRFDAVAMGDYTVRLAAANAPDAELEWPERSVTVRDDFLFDQDLDLSIRLP